MRINSARPIKAFTAKEQDGLREMLFPAKQPEVFTKNRTVDSPYAFRALSADNQSGGRVLNEHEKNIAERFFGDMIDLEVVRIVESSDEADTSTGNRVAFTVNNTIYGTDMPDDTLIHELVHVWQYNRGTITFLWALIEHATKSEEQLYEYNIADIEDENRTTFRCYEFEQQAAIVQDAYRVFIEKRLPKRNKEYKDKTVLPNDAKFFAQYCLFMAEFREWHEEPPETEAEECRTTEDGVGQVLL